MSSSINQALQIELHIAHPSQMPSCTNPVQIQFQMSIPLSSRCLALQTKLHIIAPPLLRCSALQTKLYKSSFILHTSLRWPAVQIQLHIIPPSPSDVQLYKSTIAPPQISSFTHAFILYPPLRCLAVPLPFPQMSSCTNRVSYYSPLPQMSTSSSDV